MHRKRARRILGILKKSVSWELDSEREGSTFGARWGQTNLWATGATRVFFGGADGKASIERLCISLPYVETFNSKVIKGFISELRSVFRVSGFLCSMYFVINILCTFHISVSWVWYSYNIHSALVTYHWAIVIILRRLLCNTSYRRSSFLQIGWDSEISWL